LAEPGGDARADLARGRPFGGCRLTDGTQQHIRLATTGEETVDGAPAFDQEGAGGVAAFAFVQGAQVLDQGVVGRGERRFGHRRHPYRRAAPSPWPACHDQGCIPGLPWPTGPTTLGGGAMATNNAGPTGHRRAALIALLEERARLLAPSAEVIGRALRRCVRHELRAQKRNAASVVETQPDALAEVGAAVVPASADEDTRATALPGSVPVHAIATAVAKAQTISEDEPQPPTPISEAPAPHRSHTGESTAQRRARTLEPGRQLGGYRIEALIGEGGMGQVYRATQLSMNRLVALKVLAPRLTSNARFRERFLREARAAGRLHHPNLIAVHDVNEADGLLYFSMELVEGSSIKDLISELGTIDEERALDIVRQTLDALRYAHERGIVHRDIKPDNLMLTRTGMVKVADLGLSRSDNPDDDGDEFTTKTGTMMGTPYYMPPEQGRDAHRADHRADIYATGATLYHMACGKVPFDGETAVAILINASTQPLTWPEPGPSQPVRRLIAALMARRVADRPQSASDALAMLKHLHTGPLAIVGPASADRGPIPSGRLRTSVRSRAARRRRRRWSVYGVLIALGLAMVGAGAWWEYTAGPSAICADGSVN